MFGSSLARLGKRRRSKRQVPALWETTLGTVLGNLSVSHTDDFVKMVLGDSQLRKRFTQELLRRAKHLPILGDSDTVDIVVLTVDQEARFEGVSEIAVPSVYYGSCPVGSLPYWFKAGLKHQFQNRCKANATVASRAEGVVTHDGRLEFHIVEADKDSWEPLIEAYFDHLHTVIRDEAIPSREDLGLDAIDTDIEVCDVADGVQPDTTLYDAWDLAINENRDLLTEELYERFADLFTVHQQYQDCHYKRDVQELVHALNNTGEAHISTVWVRKPRVRIFLTPE